MKERLLQTYENGSDGKEATETLGIKESTARLNIIRHTNGESMEDKRGEEEKELKLGS